MILLLSAQVLVSATFLVSGLAKLPARRATADAMISLRLPARSLHGLAATAVPIAEIVLALAVWIPVPGLPVALAALALLLVIAYWLIIARALGFEERVSCSCFGTLGSPEISGLTLGRNTLLLVLAVLSLAGAIFGASAQALVHQPVPLGQLAASVLAACLLTLLTVSGVRSSADTGEGGAPERASATDTASGSGPEEDDDLPDYERTATPFGMLQSEGEAPTTLATLTAQRAALLVWVRPGCGPCERVLNAVPAWREALEDVLTIRTLFRRPPEELDASVRERAVSTAAYDIEGNLGRSLGVRSSPGAVLLGADGMLAGGPVGGAEDVIGFVDEIIGQVTEAKRSGELAGPDSESAVPGEH